MFSEKDAPGTGVMTFSSQPAFTLSSVERFFNRDRVQIVSSFCQIPVGDGTFYSLFPRCLS
jgi:hypothetical protein